MPSSGLGGPCDHCGRTQSCCWRRGPASKPTLCNACGSRYLVKKNLEGYVPLQQRAAGVASKPQAAATKSARSRVKAPAVTLTATFKPKRGATKKLDTANWYHDSFDSEESEAVHYLTDDSDAPSSVGQTVAAPKPSLLGEPGRASKLVHITSTAQLKDLKALSSEDVAVLFEPSLRLKPRKPMKPRISVVF